MSNLFEFRGNNVEVVKLGNKIIFNPYDVGRCLDLTKSGVRNHLSKMNDNQMVKLKNSDTLNIHIRKLNNAGENFLTESGVYKLVFSSSKPEAEKFTDWVTDEVLPSIRETGSYSVEQYDNDINEFDVLRGMVDKLEEVSDKVKRVENNQEILEKRLNNLDNVDIEGSLKDTLNAMVRKYALDKGKNFGVAWGEFYRSYNRAYNTNLKLRITNHKKKTGDKLTAPQLLEKDGELKDAIRVIDKMLN